MGKGNLKIKEIPSEDRPLERLVKYGPDALSNAELVAIIIRTGSKEENAITLATRLMSTNEGVGFLSSCTVEELRHQKGIGMVKAAQIKAAIELGKRLKNYKPDNRHKITSPADAAELVMEDMRYLKKEHFRVIFLNTKNYVMDIKDLSIGSLNSSIVHPREVYSEAIRKSCSSIIVCHNHPSGDPAESQEDINITRRLHDVGKLVGIELLDHLIIGSGSYISLKERGIL